MGTPTSSGAPPRARPTPAARRTCGPSPPATRSSASSTCRSATPPATISGSDRSDAENDYATSLVALDVTTGKPAGTSRPCTTTSGTTTSAARRRWSISDRRRARSGAGPAVKQGDIYVLDRATGESLIPVEDEPAPPPGRRRARPARAHPAVLSYAHLASPADRARHVGHDPDRPALCRIQFRQATIKGFYTPPTADQPWIQYPGYNGGSDWGSVAVDPERGIIVANYNDMPNYNRLVPREEADARRTRADLCQGGTPQSVGEAGAAGRRALRHPRQCRLARALDRAALQAAALWRHPRHRPRHRQDALGPPVRQRARTTAPSASRRCCRSTSARPTMAAR